MRESNEELVNRWRCGDAIAMEQLIAQLMGLIHVFARKLGYPEASTNMDELIQEGRIAIWIAAQKFEHSRAVKFSGYAGTLIRWRVERAGKRSAALDIYGVAAEASMQSFRERDRQTAPSRPIRDCMAVLCPREATVVGALIAGRRLKDVAAMLGVSVARVGQIKTRAIAKMQCVK